MIFTASASTSSPGDLAVPVSVTGGGQPNTWSPPGSLEPVPSPGSPPGWTLRQQTALAQRAVAL